eukprot:3525920-Rhodomonas_salina.1
MRAFGVVLHTLIIRACPLRTSKCMHVSNSDLQGFKAFQPLHARTNDFSVSSRARLSAFRVRGCDMLERGGSDSELAAIEGAEVEREKLHVAVQCAVHLSSSIA